MKLTPDSKTDTPLPRTWPQLAGNAVAPYLDYGSDDKIEWIGGERDYDPKHFAELEKMKSEGADIYLPLATHD